MADLITPEALELLLNASSRTSSVSWGRTVSDYRTDKPIPGDVIATPSPDARGSERTVRFTIVDRVVESRVQTAPDEPVYTTLNVFGAHVDATVDQFGKLTYQSRGARHLWFPESSSAPSTIVLTEGPDGRFESSPTFHVKSSYEKVLRRDYEQFRLRRDPSTHVDVAREGAHSSARDNVPEISHDQFHSAQAEFERVDDNEMRRLLQKYPRLGAKSFPEIKAEVSALLRTIQESNRGHTAASYVAKDKHATQFFNEFSEVADEDIRILTRDILNKDINERLVKSLNLDTILNPEVLGENAQEGLLDYWKSNNFSKYQSALNTAVRPGEVSAAHAGPDMEAELARRVVSQRKAAIIGLDENDLFHLYSLYVEHPRDVDYASIFRLQTAALQDKQGDIEANLSDIEVILGFQRNETTAQRFGGNGYQRGQVAIGASQREALAIERIMREVNRNQAEQFREDHVPRKRTPVQTVESQRRNLLTLEGHLAGRTGRIAGGYQMQIGEGYSIAAAMDNEKDTVKIPVQQYRGDLTVNINGESMSLAEFADRRISRIERDRERMFQILGTEDVDRSGMTGKEYQDYQKQIEARRSGLSRDSLDELEAIERRLSTERPKKAALPTDTVNIPRYALGGVPGSRLDKMTEIETSRRTLAMQMGATTTEDGVTHVERLRQLLEESDVYGPTTASSLGRDIRTLQERAAEAKGDYRKFLNQRIRQMQKQQQEGKFGGYDHYISDLRDYQARVDAARGRKGAAVERLEAFVKSLEQEFYGGKTRIDPRVLVSYGVSLGRTVQGETTATVTKHDMNGQMGTSVEELAQSLTDKSKMGEFKNAFASEIGGYKGSVEKRTSMTFGNSLNLTTALISDYVAGDPTATKQVSEILRTSTSLRQAYRKLARASVSNRTVMGTGTGQLKLEQDIVETDASPLNEEGDPLDLMEGPMGATKERLDTSDRFTLADVFRLADARAEDKKRFEQQNQRYKDAIARGVPDAEPPRPVMRATGLPTSGGKKYVANAAVNEKRMEDQLDLISTIQGRSDAIQEQLTRKRRSLQREMENLHNTLPGAATTESGRFGYNELRKMREDVEALERAAANEKRNLQRRLYGVRVTDDNRLAVVTPDDIERSLADKTPIHFFGTHADDLDLLKDRTQTELQDIADVLGLHAGQIERGTEDHLAPAAAGSEVRLQALHEELRYNPHNASALHEAAVLEAQRGNITQAHDMLVNAVKGNPGNALMTQNLAVMQDIQRRTELASTNKPVLTAAALGPSPVLQTLADATEQGGDMGRISAMFERHINGQPLLVDDLTDPNLPRAFDGVLQGQAREWLESNEVFAGKELPSVFAQDMASEMIQTGVFRHMAFQNYTNPQQQFRITNTPYVAGAPRSTYAPSRSLEDRVLVNQASGIDDTSPVLYQESTERRDASSVSSDELMNKIRTNPEFAADFGREVRNEGAFLETTEGQRGDIVEGGILKTWGGSLLPLGAEATRDIEVPLAQAVAAIGEGVNLKRQFDKTAAAIRPDDPGMAIYRVTGTDFERTLTYNRAEDNLRGDSHVRALEFLQNNKSMSAVYLDTETTYDRRLRNVGAIKRTDGKTTSEFEYQTESFYKEQKEQFLIRKHIDPSLLVSEDGKQMTDAEFEAKYPEFGFRAADIKTEAEQIVETARNLRRMLAGNTVAIAHNAEFDASILADRARELAAEAQRSRGPLMLELLAASKYFEKELPRKLIDSAQIVQLAFPERTSTTLENVATDLHILQPGQQTHTSKEDANVAAQVIEEAFNRTLPSDVKIERMHDLGVMVFTDEARSPILIHNILPINTKVGRNAVEIVGTPITFDQMRMGEFEESRQMEPRVMHTLVTGYQLGQRMDQGRIRVVPLDRAMQQASTLESFQQPAIDDAARRIVRNAISPGEKSRADWQELSIMRGRIAKGFENVAADKQGEYIGGVLSAAVNRANISPAGVDFSTIEDAQIDHLRRFFGDAHDEDGNINDANLRKAVIRAGEVLETRARGIDKPFLDMVTPLYRSGQMTGEQYMQRRANYTAMVNQPHMAPSPRVVVEARRDSEERAVTLASVSDTKGVMMRTKIDLTHLDRDVVRGQLMSHARSVSREYEGAVSNDARLAAITQRVYRDVVAAAPQFANVRTPRRLSELADIMVTQAQSSNLGYRDEVLIDDVLQTPAVPIGFDRRVTREAGALTRNYNAPFEQNLSALTARNAEYDKAKKQRDNVVRERIAQAQVTEAVTPAGIDIEEGVVDTGRTFVPALRDADQTLNNRLREAFTSAIPQVSAADARTALGATAAVGGIALALMAVQNAARGSQGEAGAGDSDETPLTPDQVNRAADTDLRSGQAAQEAAEGYRKLNITIRGMHMGLNGSRLSEDALQAISNDVSATLQKHLGAELDPDGSVYGQDSTSAPARPWVINNIMGRILGRR